MTRWLQRGGWLLLLAVIVLGLGRIRFDSQVLNLLPDDVPEVAGLKLYQQHFTDSRELLITVRGADAEAAEAAARRIGEHLRARTNLAARVVWQPPWQEHPEQLAELIACLWINQPPARVIELTNRLAPDRLAAVLADAREQLATSLSPMALGRMGYDPFGLTELPGQDALGLASGETGDWFSSPDGTLRVVYVEAAGSSASYPEVRRWLEEVRAAALNSVADSGETGALQLRFTGAPAFVAEISAGMERDMRNSVLASLVIVAGLFWWAHRSWRPLLWLGAFLGVVVLATLGAGGLLWGEVNAVSTGFAAILLGLAVDYGLVLYQESTAAPGRTAGEIRRLLAPSLGWSAVTTACAFGVLMFAGLPGLVQLGSLIAIGILLSAVVMLFGFLPVITRLRRPSPAASAAAPSPAGPARKPWATVAGSVVVAMAVLSVVLVRGFRVDQGSGSLQPRHCEAQFALDELTQEMDRRGQPSLVVVAGGDEGAVAGRLELLESELADAKAAGQIADYSLPTGLWPHPDRAQTNLSALAALFPRLDAMRVAVDQAGFTPEAMTLAEDASNWWQARAGSPGVVWPTNASGQWMLRRAAARGDHEWLAAGMVATVDGKLLPESLQQLHRENNQTWITGWPQLAGALLEHVEQRLPWLIAAMGVMVTACLWLAFRRWSEVLLSCLTLGFSLLLLLGVMTLAGWSWNLMSLMAIPLLLGAGVDYTIHIQASLRRHQGDVKTVRRTTGRAVMLCAATTVTGFGSNAFSGNAGLASLGGVCAMGIALTYLTAAHCLPAWWTCWHGSDANQAQPAAAARPSVMYGAGLWSLGLFAARMIPERIATGLGRTAARIYGALQPRRLGVVERNLLPLCGDDPGAARRCSRRLYANFGAKLVQVLRREAGLFGTEQPAHWSGWERLEAAQATGRGVLLVTPHLGDWELGGTMLARRGVRLMVLTQPEPGVGFTEMRQRSRALSGIATIVVGQDPFGFVEVIRHLQDGAVLALLVDRPPDPTAVTVDLFGRPFQASIAAAELARATGCVVLPVYVVHNEKGVDAHVLPEIAYDRQQLGRREARREMTQHIISTFEPVIGKHADQWYHFIPVWPESKG